MKESLKPGKYFVEIMFESPQDNVNLPIYDTANYDVYPNGYVCIQGRKRKMPIYFLVYQMEKDKTGNNGS